MAAASRSLATAQWRARFASVLRLQSYTTTGDTTDMPFYARAMGPSRSQDRSQFASRLSKDAKRRHPRG
jgi:hypothetical protein